MPYFCRTSAGPSRASRAARRARADKEEEEGEVGKGMAPLAGMAEVWQKYGTRKLGAMAKVWHPSTLCPGIAVPRFSSHDNGFLL